MTYDDYRYAREKLRLLDGEVRLGDALSLPPLGNLWRLALATRQQHDLRVPLDDLLGVLWQTFRQCRKSFNPRRGSFENYFLHAFIHRLRDHLGLSKRALRRRRRERRAEERHGQERARTHYPAAHAEWVRDAVDALPAEDRLVVRSYYWGGLSFREVGELVGRSRDFVRRQHERILAELRRQFWRDVLSAA